DGRGNPFDLANGCISLGSKRGKRLRQGRADALVGTVTLAHQLVESDLMQLADSMSQRAVPVKVIKEWPPDQAGERDALLPELPRIIDHLFKPDVTIDRLAFDARLGDEHR